MTTFGWKRKHGTAFSKELANKFSVEAIEENQLSVDLKKKRLQKLVQPKLSNEEESRQLCEQGSTLAAEEKYWQALAKWNQAIKLTPTNEKLFEMKAQALMQLNEIFPAVEAAEEAVKLNSTWWEAHQTLGRAYMGVGDIVKAIKSFSRAIYLQPDVSELWEQDLLWARSLLEQKQKLDSVNMETDNNL